MRKKETKPRKKYVRYKDVQEGLHRPGIGQCGLLDTTIACNPKTYVRYLRRETGLSYPKIAHDLRVDSGCDVSDGTVAKWGRGK